MLLCMLAASAASAVRLAATSAGVGGFAMVFSFFRFVSDIYGFSGQ
jgi:hypothetical protein